MSFDQTQKVTEVGLDKQAEQVGEVREAEVIEDKSEIGPKILFHVINLEWTILLCALSFVFGGVFGSWILMLFGVDK